jgi:PncC family amidohydrolase
MDDQEVRRSAKELAGKLIEELSQAGETLAVAESCTGGLVAHLLTTIPGSSAVFGLSAVCYANEAKSRVLGVSDEDLESCGAVSETVAVQMAMGARRLTGATYGLATTGVAGPGGGTPDKPVGTVWFSLAVGQDVLRERLQFGGSREQIQMKAAIHALAMIRRYRERQ